MATASDLIANCIASQPTGRRDRGSWPALPWHGLQGGSMLRGSRFWALWSLWWSSNGPFVVPQRAQRFAKAASTRRRSS
jgi:hypothetical protein